MKCAVAWLFAAGLMLAGCGQDGASDQQPDDVAEASAPAGRLPEPGEAKLPPQAADFPALQSRDCRVVTQFYLDALAARAFDRAALVWDDPVIDGARLAAVFSGYAKPQIAIDAVASEGAAGSVYCTIAGTLTDAADLARPPVEGEFTLKRVNGVTGASADQSRWTLHSSSFVERLELSDKS